ncbi:MAG: Oligopeptide transport ATP-binding protein OppD, partial [uncultured Thermomicrobiales bacterium]
GPARGRRSPPALCRRRPRRAGGGRGLVRDRREGGGGRGRRGVGERQEQPGERGDAAPAEGGGALRRIDPAQREGPDDPFRRGLPAGDPVAADRDGLPGGTERAEPGHQGRRPDRGAAAPGRSRREAGGAGAGGGAAGAGWALRGVLRALPARAERRPEATGGDRDSAGARSRPPDPRRANLGPRRQRPGADHEPAQGPERGPRDLDALHHPRHRPRQRSLRHHRRRLRRRARRVRPRRPRAAGAAPSLHATPARQPATAPRGGAAEGDAGRTARRDRAPPRLPLPPTVSLPLRRLRPAPARAPDRGRWARPVLAERQGGGGGAVRDAPAGTGGAGWV